MQVVEEFYRLLAKKMSVTDFEQWVYATPTLETIMSEDDYLGLITLNYKSNWAFYELEKLLKPYVDRGEMHKRELLELLHTLADGGSSDDILAALLATFNLFCKGYSFFEELAHYGVTADDDFGWDPEGKWHRMTDRQKQWYLSEFYPEVQLLANQLIENLTSGAIFVQPRLPAGAAVFTDTRDIAARNKRVMASKNGDWWQFWK
ncbi:hypothetical protein [Hymenobacter norwichensis]|uniref:hypothetical protein n=1 Tax=Hymenobacter norwichensis TaxID=223903 RepID=UPI0003B79439|nr:hypothetical protein [Hymenobacter norwichensis]